MTEEKFSLEDGEKKSRRANAHPGSNLKAGGLALTLGALGLGYVVLTADREDRPQPLDTSTADEFQSERIGPRNSAFPNLDGDPVSFPPSDAPTPHIPDPSRTALQEEVERLRNLLAAGRGEQNGLRQELTDLDARLDEMRAEAELARQEAEEARRRTAAELEAQLAEIRAGQEARRRAEGDEAIAAATRARQVVSKSIVFDQGSRGSNLADPASAAETSGAALYNPDGSRRDPTIDERGRGFVERARPVAVTRSGTLANPGITLSQGTIIRATLDTALASNLPGQIVATVNTPVESMDGSRILVQSGSRLFGEYQTAQGIGERRIQVAWSRILTPDGVSIELESFGADQLGRSGVTGRVDSRWGTRFAAAALISFIGIGPALLAENARSETEEDAITDMGQSLVTALAPTVGQYMNLPPIINVRQGSAVTVIVNKDIEVLR